jgi:hypothetical protein
LPCTPSINYAHLFANYKNTSNDYTNFSGDYAHNSDDCVNIPNDQANIDVDSADTPDISFVDFCIPNFALLQLLLVYKSKIKTMFTIGPMICFLSSSFFIYGFCT